MADDEPLKRRERVVAATDLPGVPSGTPGRVVVVTGLEWTRYRVRFDNGVEIGSLDRRFLARPGDKPGGDRDRAA